MRTYKREAREVTQKILDRFECDYCSAPLRNSPYADVTIDVAGPHPSDRPDFRREEVCLPCYNRLFPPAPDSQTPKEGE